MNTPATASRYLNALLKTATFIVLMVGTLVSSGFLAGNPSNEEVAEATLSVVINQDQVLETEMSKEVLLQRLKGETLYWPDQTKIRLALMKSTTPTGKQIAEKLMEMELPEFDKHYLELVFQGKIDAPKFYSSEEDLRAYVKTTPGAIGIVSKDNVSGLLVAIIDGEKTL